MGIVFFDLFLNRPDGGRGKAREWRKRNAVFRKAGKLHIKIKFAVNETESKRNI